jgi:hypothetical protein
MSTSTLPPPPPTEDGASSALYSPQALLLLALALFCTTEAAVRLRAPSPQGHFLLTPLPQQQPPLPPPPPLLPPRRAALLYFGNVGALSYDAKESGAAWTLEPALGARPYIQQHVLDFNGARGWEFDTFLHTWQAQHEEALVELLQPRNHSAGAQPLHGALAHTGMMQSLDLVLQLMLASQVEQGLQYDRVLFVRYDTVFYRGFDLGALTEDDAFYAASWCTADRAAPLPAIPGTQACYATHTYWADEEGLPDFWFAGSPAGVTPVFERLPQRIASGAIKVGRTCNGCNHAQLWGSVRESGVPLRRWGYHQIDSDIFRDSVVCSLKWRTAPLEEVPWLNLTSAASPDGDSVCQGSMCAVDAGEMLRCAGWSKEPRPWLGS